MSFDAAELARALDAHGPVARVVLAEVRGSTPRETGTAMLVWDGGQDGTIGGGALEYQAAKRARDVLARGMDREVVVQPLGPGLGQCCGGAVTLLIERFVVVPQAFPRITAIGASGPVPDHVTARAASAVETGTMEGWLIEPLAAQGHPLWIWGAGHVGRALVATLAPLPDLAITWIDTAAERFPEAIPDGVDQLIAGDPARVLFRAPQATAHVILTYSHDIDLALCHAALSHGFGSCGLIGSHTKWARFRSRLDQLGHSPAQISRITCPIGDLALGKHPQAIAIGVAAGLLNRHMIKGVARTPAGGGTST